MRESIFMFISKYNKYLRFFVIGMFTVLTITYAREHFAKAMATLFLFYIFGFLNFAEGVDRTTDIRIIIGAMKEIMKKGGDKDE